MTIIGVTCAKNEEDIIEAFVRHNLFYLQKLIVLDHGSTDSTSSILSRLVAEGLPLVVENDPSLGKFQAEKMTRLMHLAVNEHGADWVLLLDADELIRCDGDHLPLPEAGNSTGFLKVGWQTYQVRPSDDPSVINPVERIQHRLAEEPYEHDTLDKRRYLVKAVVPRALAGKPGTCVTHGNHFILSSNQEPPHTFWPGFDYAHFSLRSAGHYSSKIAILSLQEAYRSSHRGGNTSYYLAHLEELKTDFEGFSRRFYERIPSYMEQIPSFTPVIIHDPLPYRGGPLRYTSCTSDYTRLVANLIGYAEVLVKEAATHAAATPAASNQVDELARLEFSGPEVAGVIAQTISASSRLLQTVRFPLDNPRLSSATNLRIACLSAVVELVQVRWIWDHPEKECVLSGKLLREKTFIVHNAFPIQHAHYFAFIKGNADSVIGLQAPPTDGGQILKAVEIQIQLETDPTRIGVKLLQNNVIDGMLAATHPIALLQTRVTQLNKKLAQRTTLPGACGFQIYRLWRAVSGLFKKAG
ncbi:glycosyltransferase family 2 protein [Rariglobus hedericola]|nr:glycosyltransferase family 2 protein [Rariglobus hedericola]